MQPEAGGSHFAVEEPPLTAEAEAMTSQLQADWIDLHDLDRARRIAAIKRTGASNYQIAAGLKFSESTVRNLLWTLKAPAEDQLLARHNPVSTRELVRRAKDAIRQRESRRQEAFELRRSEAARNAYTLPGHRRD